jgi:hypothetical protein
MVTKEQWRGKYYRVEKTKGFVILRMLPIGCPETSVRITTTRCVITQKNTVLKTKGVGRLGKVSKVSGLLPVSDEGMQKRWQE